jgi:DmsE family decaheme c-type cytochrome
MDVPRPWRVAAALALFAAGAALWTVAPGGASAEDAASAWSKAALAARFPNPDAKAGPDDYAGSIECRECHENRWKSLGTSFHAEIRNEKKSGTHGCETCHGPGRVHTDEAGEAPIRHPAKADVAVSLGVCLACHAEVLEKPVLEHRKWILDRAGQPRRCTTCHLVHVDKTAPAFDPNVGPFPDKASLAAAVAAADAKEAAAIAAALKEAAARAAAKAKPGEAPPPAVTPPVAPPAVATPLPPPGTAVCATCHTSFHPEMKRSGHANLLTEGEQCATCHGNGRLHAASGGDPKKILRPDEQAPAAADQTCLDCHRDADVTARWTCAEHSREKIACVVCHDPNAPKKRTLRGSEFELCGGCHLDVKAKFRLANRHRVEEGRVLCSDCHDPHGNTSKMRGKDVRLRVCGECHVEKAGPFLFDHGIKRTEGCVACHDPHGSVNRRMLSYSRIKPLCLQCHPETGHDLADRKYDNCIACHVEIHGSDLDRKLRR